MKKLILLALVGMIGSSLSGVALGKDEAPVQTKAGIVKKVDVAAKQIVVMVARELTFTVTDATQIVQGTTSKKIDDIKVDAKVTVEYVKEGEKRPAKKIIIEK